VGKSVKFPIHFAGHNPLEKVFTKICSIEESRELSKHSSNEDLNKFANQAAAAHNHEAVNSDAGTSEQGCRENNSSGSAQQRPSVDPIIAELDMLDEKLSEGEGSIKKVLRRRRHHDSSRGQKPRSHSSSAQANSEEGSSCSIF